MQINNRLFSLSTHPLVFLIIRIVLGGVFLLFGFSKAIAPIEEFISVIRTYEMLPSVLVPAAAVTFIVAEIVCGLFFILGLFTKQAAQGILILLTLFIIALSQAMLRGIALENCGCSGGIFHIGETPQSVLIRDLIMFAGILWFLKYGSIRYTIDEWLSKSSQSSTPAAS